jgi:hypothetical protein
MSLFLHVDEKGRRRGADGSAERPFATPHAALAHVRGHFAIHPRVPVIVQVHPGTYEFERTLELRPADSGTAECPVIFFGGVDGGNRPVFSGGRRLADWEEIRHRGQRCWTMDLPEVREGGWHFTQLFVNGVRRPRTRIPAWDGLADGVQRFSAASPFLRFVASPGDAPPAPGTCLVPKGVIDPGWRNLADVEIVALRYWVDRHYAIKAYDPARGLVSTFTKQRLELVDEKGEGCRFWIENVGEALSVPGQWYLDRAAGRLSYLPLPGETRENTEVVAPRLPFLVRFLGSVDDPAYGGRALAKVRNIWFTGIRFAHAEYRYPRVNPGVGQAQFNLPGAITLRGAEDCEFRNCELAHVSQYGIEVMKGSRNNRILHCHLHDLGAGAVKVNHDGLHIRADSTGSGAFAGMAEIAPDWAGRDLPRGVVHGARTTVGDCTIHGIGRVYPCNAAIWIGDSARNTLVHNHIYDTYYSAISVGWVWGYHRARACDNLVADNRIHDIGQGLLSDMGAIYLLGVQPGTVIRGNYIRDVVAHGYGGGGIYPDEGSSFMVIENNVVVGALSGAFTQHYGRDNRVRNNVFALSDEALMAMGRCELYRGFIARGNLLLSANGHLFTGLGIRRCRFRKNFYWSAGKPPTFPMAEDYAAWRRAADDAGAILADPGVALRPDGTLSVAKKSRAVRAGFRPFDVSQAGPRFRVDGKTPVPMYLNKKGLRGLPDVRLDVGVGAKYAKEYFSPAPDPLVTNRRTFYDLDEPTPICLVVKNAGDGRARGSIRVVLRNADGGRIRAGRLSGKTTLAFDLAPGAMAIRDLVLHADPRCRRLTVETKVKGKNLIPSAIHLQRRSAGTVARIGDCALAEVRAALADQPALVGLGAPPEVACARMALTPKHVAIHADITDALVKTVLVPWDGSVFEVFSAMPRTNGRDGNAQIFLQPGCDGMPAQARKMEKGVVPAEEIQVDFLRTERGYEIWALIPLATAKLRHDAPKILFEVMFTVRLPGEAAYRKYSLHGEPSGIENAGWACLSVVEG